MPRPPLPFPLDIDTLHSLKDGGFILAGTATLASGTVTISDRTIRNGSVPFVSYAVPAGTTGTNLKAVCAQGSLTITAIGTGGSTVTTDTSEVSYLIFL
jgi:hypothetical protein